MALPLLPGLKTIAAFSSTVKKVASRLKKKENTKVVLPQLPGLEPKKPLQKTNPFAKGSIQYDRTIGPSTSGEKTTFAIAPKKKEQFLPVFKSPLIAEASSQRVQTWQETKEALKTGNFQGKAAFDVAKGIPQGIVQSGAKLALAAKDVLEVYGPGAINKEQRDRAKVKVSQNPTSLELDPQASKAEKFLFKGLFGTDRVSGFAEDVAKTELAVEPYVGKRKSKFGTAPLLVGFTALDFSGLGGGKKQLIEALVKESDEIVTRRLLKEVGVSDDLIPSYAKKFAETSDRKVVEEGLTNLEKLQSTTKATQSTSKDLKPIAQVADGTRNRSINDEILQLAQTPHVPYAQKKIVIAPVSDEIAEVVRNASNINAKGFQHTIDNDGIRHALKKHGNDPIPLIAEDFKLAPDIIRNYDLVEDAGRTAIGQPGIRYTKRFNGTTYYVEEVLNKRGELRFKTMYKTKTPSGASTVQAGLAPTSTLPEGKIPTPSSVNDATIASTIRDVKGSQKVTNITYKQLDDLAIKLNRKDLTVKELESVRAEVAGYEIALEQNPAKPLIKYVSKKTGGLPEITGKRGGSEFAQRGDQIIQEVFGSGATYGQAPDIAVAEKAVDDYMRTRKKLNELKTQASEIRLEKSAVKKGEQLMQLAKGDRRSAYRALKNAYDLTEAELSTIRQRRDIMAMSRDEFDSFIAKAEKMAEDLAQKRQARIQLEDTIQQKEFRKLDNLRQALNLPLIEKMNVEELGKFDEILQQFKVGDEFLGVRQLETVKNTDLADIKTIREAKAALAKQMGVPVEQLDTIKVSELDRYRYDTALARQNPFYDLLVTEKNKAFLNAEAVVFDIREKIDSLITAARKSRKEGVLNKLIPTDKKIFQWLEADDTAKLQVAKGMTPEELEAATYIRDLYVEARDYLVQHEVLKKFRTDYITHIRRGFLEAWKEDGLVSAFKEVFKQHKLDEAYFNILDQKTSEILPLEKFFQFSLRRTGELVPSQNVSRAVVSYFRAFEKKRALDSIVPKLDIYAHSLTPRKLTPKGLEFDDSLKRFVKEWMNTKKGRVTDIVKPGGKIDWTLRTGVALTRILDLGFSIPIGLASFVGEQVSNLRGMGVLSYSTGVRRLATRQGRAITTKYKNFTSESLMDSLKDTSKDIQEKLLEGLFALFHGASRKGNQVFLLGSMTPEEFAKGTISTERLARLQVEMGRTRVVSGFESIVGATSPGKVITQYKSWAIPHLATTIDDFAKLGSMFKNRDPKIFRSKEFKDLFRTTLIGTVTVLAYYGFTEELADKKDRSFAEELAFKAGRDAMTLIGAMDPTLFASNLRLLAFLGDLSTSLKQIVTIEKYKDGDLKGPKKLQKTLTPAVVRQFTPKESGGTKPKGNLPGSLQLPKLPGLPGSSKLPKLPGL